MSRDIATGDREFTDKMSDLKKRIYSILVFSLAPLSHEKTHFRKNQLTITLNNN